MQIVIDEAIVSQFSHSLSEALGLLKEAYAQRDTLKKEADANQLLTIQQACDYLGKDEDTLRYYRKHGLDYYKKGQQGVWYRKGEIDEWLAEGKISLHKR